MRSALILILLFSPALTWANSINIPTLRDCIEPLESADQPYPDGAVRIETLPNGVQTISRGRYQISETTLAQFFPNIHASFLANPIVAKKIMDKLLSKYLSWHPRATPKRLAYAHFAGPNSKPYTRKAKELLAEKAAKCYILQSSKLKLAEKK